MFILHVYVIVTHKIILFIFFKKKNPKNVNLVQPLPPPQIPFPKLGPKTDHADLSSSLDRKVIMRSVLINNMLSDVPVEQQTEPVPLSNVSENVPKKVIERCEHHKNTQNLHSAWPTTRRGKFI